MTTPDLINQLVQLQAQIYASFSQRSDSVMDLLDLLCANTGANSVVELSLNPLFRRVGLLTKTCGQPFLSLQSTERIVV
ncbi:hypothetical protein [Leptothoe sp. PORK10 BA2]|uniref:hypothetical protein n=1 Tax=Leptothoe sp. PORK10 BA2 TaxID=3110254 RepID=UPI002B21210B|nr:hypothetical protein [Leptothoe sp. PORK10 BA2]MEA5465727.1 hypothetical protein [Leptothoe sp. PORK10 BA2]